MGGNGPADFTGSRGGGMARAIVGEFRGGSAFFTQVYRCGFGVLIWFRFPVLGSRAGTR